MILFYVWPLNTEILNEILVVLKGTGDCILQSVYNTAKNIGQQA